MKRLLCLTAVLISPAVAQVPVNARLLTARWTAQWIAVPVALRSGKNGGLGSPLTLGVVHHQSHQRHAVLPILLANNR